MRIGFATLLLSSAVLAATPSLAQAPTTGTASRATDAEALIAKGVALRQEGKDGEALTFFRRAYEASPSARARAQIGLGEQALGMWLEAETDLVAALADAADPWVKRYREPLENALAIVRGRLGSLELVVNVPDAEVSVDGAKLGSGAGPFRVVSGTRSVVVHAPLHHAVSRSVTVPGGGVARETFELVAAPTGVEPRRGEGRAPEFDARPATSPPSAQRTLGWGLIGGSAVVLLGGGIAQVVRELDVSKYNESTCPGRDTSTELQPQDCQLRISAAHTWQTLAIVGYAGAGALAATGAILLLTAPSAKRNGAGLRQRGAPPRCAATPSAGGATLWCEARF